MLRGVYCLELLTLMLAKRAKSKLIHKFLVSDSEQRKVDKVLKLECLHETDVVFVFYACRVLCVDIYIYI